ncbi:MAG TPA: DUF4226 domain-containing protein [Steroidobacteraceae bacterium]|nr:DUF4226 domain-containing protein [Steroidobacteraceae bacterium]
MNNRIIILTTIGLGVALCGCATSRGNLTNSADRLERNADLLSDHVRDEPVAADYAPAGYTRDARALAEQAHEFRRVVQDGRADDRDVKVSFEQLSRRYHDLRDDVDRSDSHRAQADLRPVTDAYLDVEREMGGYPGHRYAEGDVPPRD